MAIGRDPKLDSFRSCDRNIRAAAMCSARPASVQVVRWLMLSENRRAEKTLQRGREWSSKIFCSDSSGPKMLRFASCCERKCFSVRCESAQRSFDHMIVELISITVGR